jgi:predicted nucleic acid-binding protein
MAQQVFLDTDILIDFSQDQSEAVETLAQLEEYYEFNISVIVAMELYAGARSKKEMANIDSLLSDFKISFLTQGISEQALAWMKEFRPSHGVEINDMLIGATAFSTNTAFISKNQKHYRFLPDLNLLEYPWSGV